MYINYTRHNLLGFAYKRVQLKILNHKHYIESQKLKTKSPTISMGGKESGQLAQQLNQLHNYGSVCCCSALQITHKGVQLHYKEVSICHLSRSDLKSGIFFCCNIVYSTQSAPLGLTFRLTQIVNFMDTHIYPNSLDKWAWVILQGQEQLIRAEGQTS